MNLWMVRAEREGLLYEEFRKNSVVAIGWSRIGNLNEIRSWDELRTAMSQAYPDFGNHKLGRTAGMLWRMKTEISEGDHVLTYDPARRTYLFGTVSGPYAYQPELITGEDGEWPHTRPVTWLEREIPRDALSAATRNSLGSLITLFKLPGRALEEFLNYTSGNKVPLQELPQDTAQSEDESGASIEDIEGRSLEFIKDMIVQVAAEDMEHLVAGLMRALGYKTRVSPAGPDRGQDILASPDALGLEDPRVVVEVKHRKGTIGAPEIRSFLGGRRPSDRGLYVSTGGFTKDARYEADRATIPLRLMTIDELVDLIVTHYEKLDVETRALIPLKRVYWPLS